MKILFDFISYQISAQRGIGRYILSMYEHMIKLGGFESYILVSNKYPLDLPETVIKSGKIYMLESWNDYNIDIDFDFFFRGDFFPSRGDTDLSTILPVDVVKQCKQIVGIMYDLIPLVFAKNYLSQSTLIENYAKAMDNLNLVSHLFAISENSRQDCIKLLGVHPKDITTIYGSSDEQKFLTKNSNKKYDAANRANNLICVPGDDLRKNYTGAVRGFCMAYQSGKIPSDSKLYIICRILTTDFKSNITSIIKDFQHIEIGKQIIITDYIPDAIMIDLLSNARASIFPSFYEGLGLPILESYIAGTPAIGSNLSSTKELLLPECSFNPYNNEEIAQSIINIFADEGLCQKSLDFGKKIIKEKYNWDNCAKIIITKLKKLSEQDTRLKKVAVFSCLPPQQSGIAIYTYNAHSIHPEMFDIISDIDRLSDYQNLLHDDFKITVYGKDLPTQTEHVVDGMYLSFSDFNEKRLASFGPYITLDSGQYNLIIEYESDDKADIDFKLTADCAETFLLDGKLDAKQNKMIIPFSLDKEYKNIECSLFYMGKSLLIKKISFVKAKEKKPNNTIPYDMYPYAKLSRDYIGKIFVFGNSPHHGVALEEAIKSNGENHRFAYMHEAIILGSFVSILNKPVKIGSSSVAFPDLKVFLKTWYPFIADELENNDSYDTLRKNNLCGIRPFIEMTGIHDFIVNNETAKSLILSEVERLNLGTCNIQVLFHPVPDLTDMKKDKSLDFGDAEFVVGSFGIPNYTKRSDDIIRAINKLNNAGHKIKLVLGGYDAVNNANNMGLDLNNVVIFNNPSDVDLINLMKSVDCAIQLRKNPHGESSGCIAQLLGMGQNLITQTGFVMSDFQEYCTLISQNASVDEIADAILNAMKNKNKKIPESLIKQYSFEELSKKLYDLAVKG